MIMERHKSAEDYLEAILMLKEERSYIKSVNIAEIFNVSKPSVSTAVKCIRKNGYITIDRSGFITLTDTALDDACKVEHDISDKTFKAIKKQIKKMS